MERRHLRKALQVLVHGEVNHLHKRYHKRAKAAYDKSAQWRKAAGVVGYGIAERVTQGRRRRELTLKVYVKKKKPRGKIRYPVPRSLRIPGVRGVIGTDVVEVGEVTLQLSIIPGADIGHVQDLNGTLGCVVRRPQDVKQYILSNAHVLAPLDKVKLGDAIIQPSAPKGGSAPTNTIATVFRWAPLIFSETGFPNRVDAAIAEVVHGVDVVAEIPRIGIPRGVSNKIKKDMPVRKVGGATDYTESRVIDPDFVIELDYVAPDGTIKRVGFRDQVQCEPFTKGGDSGALVLNEIGEAVGLHFAGSSLMSVFNRIGNVLDELQVELVTA